MRQRAAACCSVAAESAGLPDVAGILRGGRTHFQRLPVSPAGHPGYLAWLPGYLAWLAGLATWPWLANPAGFPGRGITTRTADP